MKGGRSLEMILVGFWLAVVGGACSRPPSATSTEVGAQVGKIGVTVSATPDDGVTEFRIDVSQGGAVIATQTVQRASVTATGSGFPAGDAFFVLLPGLYDVTVTPLGPDGSVSKNCAPATQEAQVASGMTTEIALTLPCNGVSTGGLDVVVKTTDPPTITGLVIDPNKFTATCAPIALTVTAVDPNHEALAYGWKILSVPKNPGPDAPVTQLVGSGASASFFTDLAGDYTLQVTVTNADGLTVSLSFPIHVIAGDTTNCNPRFDTLNAWSPPGPAVDDLTYGQRVHVFPVPGTPLPDPICHLTAHGGPVMPSPVIHPVLWGTTVNATFSASMTALYTSLFTDPQFSSYLGVMTQYTGAATTGSVAAPVTITPMNPSTTLSESDIQQELGLQIRNTFLPAPTGSDLYVVMLPSSITGTLSGFTSCVAGGFCAYHGSFLWGSSEATFAVMPDCGPGACAVAGSHELIEAMTDPMIGFVGNGPGDNLAWYDDEQAPCNGEIADLCEGDDYSLGGTMVAAAWSDELGQCQVTTLNPPACGTLGAACCAGICNVPNSGCDQTSTCVACPPAAPTPTLLTHEEDQFGSNFLCASNDQTVNFGPSSCGAGVQRAFLKTISLDVSNDATCSAHWVTSDPGDCRVQIDYHVPADCTKHVHCDTQIFVTSGALPTTAVRADLFDIQDGHTWDSDHFYTIGGPCDPGYHHPDAPPTPTVISGDQGQTCAANWSDPTNPNDCTAVVKYHLGDQTKSITCDTQVVEVANPSVVPAGCP